MSYQEMSPELAMQRMSPEFLQYDGFFDSTQKIIPDGSDIGMLVTGGFLGVPEGKAINICRIDLVVVEKGDYYGQKYKYNAKIFDIEKPKQQAAWTNLMCLDAQAGFPLSNYKMQPSTEAFEQHWAGIAHVRACVGLFISEEGKEINYIKSFRFWREKMLPDISEQGQQAADQASAQQCYAAASTGAVAEEEIDF